MAKGRGFSVPQPVLPMTTKASAPVAAAKKKLLGRIAAAQRQADLAKKTAKLAKHGLRAAKDKFKAARRAAKKLRKSVKVLKGELAALATKPASRRRVAPRLAKKRVRPAPASAPVPVPAAIESVPAPSDTTPVQ